jgi:transmembrane sensor
MGANFEHMDDLIAKFLSGEASREEIAQVESWRKESGENEEYFQESLNILNTVNSFSQQQAVDVDKAWKRLDSRITGEDVAKVIPLSTQAKVWRAAAAIVLIAMLGVLVRVFTNTESVEPVVVAATKAPKEQKLPDGTTVFVNKNSEVSFEADKHTRKVKLKGEAYFEVVHDEKQPFEITVGDVIIKDIGTSFNVKAIPGSNVVEVLVEDGEVQFYSAENKGLNLVKGEKAIYDQTTKKFTKSIPNPVENTTSYKSRIFHFNGTPLREVIRQINDVYESHIKLDDDRIGNCRLSVVFTNEKIDAVVSTIAETLDLQTIAKGDTLVLKGATCAEK